METTLEVRWFERGTPPAAVQHWFEFECPGELLEEEPEVREDLYACQKPEDLHQFQEIALRCSLRIAPDDLTNREAINLKLREGSWELKLRQQQLGIQRFDNANSSLVWTGKIERWHKLREPELIDSGLLSLNSIPKADWISVSKKRVQRIKRDVKSELTWLKIDNKRWWSIGFEMNQNCNDRQQDRCFKEVIQRSCQSYYGCKLSAKNSYSYSRWLLLLNQ